MEPEHTVRGSCADRSSQTTVWWGKKGGRKASRKNKKDKNLCVVEGDGGVQVMEPGVG